MSLAPFLFVSQRLHYMYTSQPFFCGVVNCIAMFVIKDILEISEPEILTL